MLRKLPLFCLAGALTVLTGTCAFAFSEIREPDPVITKNGMPEDSVLLFGDNPGIGELVKRMEAGDCPAWCKITAGSDLKTNVGTTNAAQITDIYNLLSKIRVDDKTEGVEPEASDPRCLTFYLEDVGNISFVFDSESVYEYEGKDGYVSYCVSDVDGLWEYVGEMREYRHKFVNDWEAVDDVLFRAVNINMGLVDGNDDHWTETRYALTRDGSLYILEKHNISGFNSVKEVTLDADDFEKLKGLLEDKFVKYGNGGTQAADGDAWNMYLYDDEDVLEKAFSGNVCGLEDLEAISDMLKDAAPVIIY